MKYILLLLLLFNETNAQNDFKKIIWEDLHEINAIYESITFLDKESGLENVIIINTEISNAFEGFKFYKLEVKFNNVFFPVSIGKPLIYYVLKSNSDGGIYKFSGFLSSYSIIWFDKGFLERDEHSSSFNDFKRRILKTKFWNKSNSKDIAKQIYKRRYFYKNSKIRSTILENFLSKESLRLACSNIIRNYPTFFGNRI